MKTSSCEELFALTGNTYQLCTWSSCYRYGYQGKRELVEYVDVSSLYVASALGSSRLLGHELLLFCCGHDEILTTKLDLYVAFLLKSEIKVHQEDCILPVAALSGDGEGRNSGS